MSDKSNGSGNGNGNGKGGKVLALPAPDTSPDEVMDLLLAGELTRDEYAVWSKAREQHIAEAAASKAKAAAAGPLVCKVAWKGGLSLYGLQRQPVTLYVEQWEKLLGFADDIRTFIAENEGKEQQRKDAKGEMQTVCLKRGK